MAPETRIESVDEMRARLQDATRVLCGLLIDVGAMRGTGTLSNSEYQALAWIRRQIAADPATWIRVSVYDRIRSNFA